MMEVDLLTKPWLLIDLIACYTGAPFYGTVVLFANTDGPTDQM